MKEKITLLTWMAVNNDPAALESLLNNLRRRYSIKQVLYLYQKDHAEKLEKIKSLCSELAPIEITLKNPTAHREIYNVVKQQIVPIVESEPNLFINVSSGTPAMHAVWLILFASGCFRDGTRLISSQINRKTNALSCDDVDFPITTYLGEIHRLERENPKEPIYRADAKSKARIEAFEKIKAYASIPGVPLLLLGERGIGKSRIVESFITTIKKKGVVTVACGSLDSTLVESTIFGHKKGSFTGANNDKSGLLKEADGKILFLDEIQDLPKSVQRKLVRTLQDKKHHFRPLGSNEEETTDIELVCATNLPEKELKEKLDPDFYDRISFYRVELPPLRECREDLLDDWREVWKSTHLDSSPKEAPEDECLLKFFRKSELPGNFRNLQSVAYQIIAWKGKKTMEEILKEISFENVEKRDFNIADYSEFQNKKWSEATKSFQQSLAEYACKKYGTQGEAAKKLGCTPKTLQNALKNK